VHPDDREQRHSRPCSISRRSAVPPPQSCEVAIRDEAVGHLPVTSAVLEVLRAARRPRSAGAAPAGAAGAPARPTTPAARTTSRSASGTRRIAWHTRRSAANKSTQLYHTIPHATEFSLTSRYFNEALLTPYLSAGDLRTERGGAERL
jgi:hypothetical protein